VLASQLACLDAVKPGVDFHDYHKAAERVLAQGYIDLGLCEGTLDSVLESGSYKQFYMHRAGHWLGMDVHDAGLYQVKGASQKLRPGMVLTVEPGTYIRPAENVPEAFWNIGRAHRGRRDGDGKRPREFHGGHAEDRGRGRAGLHEIKLLMETGRAAARLCICRP
jgi:hypothetical protein